MGKSRTINLLKNRECSNCYNMLLGPEDYWCSHRHKHPESYTCSSWRSLKRRDELLEKEMIRAGTITG